MCWHSLDVERTLWRLTNDQYGILEMQNVRNIDEMEDPSVSGV